MTRKTITTFASLLLIGGSTVFADPCGMVPPVYLKGDVDLERIGLQKTFVFYKDGVETFVIRPGFQGSVEDFGMLIPFPSPPAMRKVADNTFAHIAAAIDPPEVLVDLSPIDKLCERQHCDACLPAAFGAETEKQLSLNEVQVLNQEAVGMYEVAVLQAGSAAVLNEWMTDHGFRYPDGMDDVCNDYVEDRWCFVAIKARIGRKNGVDPEPGMEKTDASLASGTTFDGHVQGMGFRFQSEELVVPMRLSAFNAGDLHNVVYVLTDHPLKAENMPAEHVVRQVDGKQLLHNITQPLPLRIVGGKFEDIPAHQKETLKLRRNPAPHNGIAKTLFAGDLVAARTGRLSHAHEEVEKELLDIGERLGLRGPAVDAQHLAALNDVQEAFAATALAELESMTMTVLDGAFEREVIAKENVRFTRFEMNPGRNNVQRYNARLFRASSEGPTLSTTATATTNTTPTAVAITHPLAGKMILQEAASQKLSRKSWLRIGCVVLATVFAGVVLIRRRGGSAAGTILVFLSLGTTVAEEPATKTAGQLILNNVLAEIHDGSDRSAAIGRVAAAGEAMAPALAELIRDRSKQTSIQDRGWAVVCLNSIGGQAATAELTALSQDQHVPPLVRIWSAAAMIGRTESLAELRPYAQMLAPFPSLQRPVESRITALLSREDADWASLLKMSASNYHIQQLMGPTILKAEPATLTQILMTNTDTNVRRQAAAWLATLKQNGVAGVNEAVIKAVRFGRTAARPPWGDGPLFIPGVNWEKQDAVRLVNELTAWYVWCEHQRQQDQTSKIVTNLNSWQLMTAAGYCQVPSDALSWLIIWRQQVGPKATAELMKRTGYRLVPASLSAAAQ